jgi:hypothetical protein
MKQLKVLGVAFIAILALTSIAATLAQAAATLPSLLPEATPASNITAVSKSGVSTFGHAGILELESTSSAGTLTGNSLKLGSFQIAFKETTNIATGLPCTGLSSLDGTGVVLVQGTYHIRDFKENSTLLVAATFLLLPVHFTCAGKLFIVLGCVAGAVTPESVLTKFLVINLAKNGTLSDNLIITVLNEANTAEEACQLSFGEGTNTEKLGFEVTKQEISKFEQGGKEITVLVMPL